MASLVFIDVAPDPVGMGVVAVVVLFVICFVFLLAAALVVFLWFRKRSMRHLEIGRPENDPQFFQ
jgi:hypothetical protein